MLPVILDDPDAVFQSLTTGLHDTDRAVRLQAAVGLANYCSGRRDVAVTMPVLLEGLRHENAAVRHQMVRTIGYFGSEAKGALPALGAALRDDVAAVREEAAHTIQATDRAEGK